jgi:hypothetical protein
MAGQDFIAQSVKLTVSHKLPMSFVAMELVFRSTIKLDIHVFVNKVGRKLQTLLLVLRM